jgi:hypothetical protein
MTTSAGRRSGASLSASAFAATLHIHTTKVAVQIHTIAIGMRIRSIVALLERQV